MRSFFFRLVKLLGIVLLLAIAQIILFLLMSPNWSSINLMFVFLTLFMLRHPDGIVVWMGFGVSFFVELYATTPFGIILFSGTISVFVAYCLFQYLFTNQSLYAAIAICLSGVVSYRFFYAGLLLITQLISHSPLIPLLFLLRVYGWEAICTTAFTGLLYYLFERISEPRVKFILFQ